MNGWRLLADIGGTNARFARSRPDGEIFARRSYKVTNFADFETALQAYQADAGTLAACNSAAIAAAGPVVDGHVRLTNAHWQLSEAGIAQILSNVPTRLFNDLEAAALALPHLQDTDIEPIGDVRDLSSQRRRMLALGVGTGFGAAMIFPCNGGWVTCPSEAGHMSFAALEMTEPDLPMTGGSLGLTVEDVLSGHGLVRLYQARCNRLGTEVLAVGANDVYARVSIDTAAQQALQIFTLWLGRVARNLVLASAGWGGVFLTGGVIQGWRGVASHRQFRDSFESEGKMQVLLSRTLTAVIIRDDCSLFGLARTPIC